MKITFGRGESITMVHLSPLPPLGHFGEDLARPSAALVAALDALRAANSVHWITYGTLLGWMREGQFLDHDDDIDIALSEGANPQHVITEMTARGFSYIQFSESARGIVNQKFISGRGVMVDLFYLVNEGAYRVDEYKVVGHSLARGTHPTRPVEYFTPEALGVAIPVPSDSETYLAHLYGKNWRTPVTYWDWVFSPPNTHLLLRPVDLPILVARWGIHKMRQVRRWLRS